MVADSVSKAPDINGLSALVGRPLPTHAHGLEEEQLLSALAPIVRLALRRGTGVPSVVAWVRRTHAALADGRHVPRDHFAPQITRLLCAAFLADANSPKPANRAASRGGKS